MRFLLRLASGICLFGALFAVGIASGWAAGRDTVSTATTTTAESTTPAETTTTETATTETATTSTETGTRLGHDHGDDHRQPDRRRRGRSCRRVVERRVGATDWGWVAFGILAAVVVIGGIVWLVVRRRRPRTA